MTAIAPTMQAFFTDRLMNQPHASPHTIASYRDTMRLLLAFARQRHWPSPASATTTPPCAS
jgi:site-specific recombinase XerC